MSARHRSGPTAARKLRAFAPVFAALGDETRLQLVARLSGGTALSIARLAEDAPVSRQAITKHLRVLEDAGLVHGVRRGRENLFQLSPRPLDEARDALGELSRAWDQALGRLKLVTPGWASYETQAPWHAALWSANQWVKIRAEWDTASADALRIYVNGVRVDTTRSGGGCPTAAR